MASGRDREDRPPGVGRRLAVDRVVAGLARVVDVVAATLPPGTPEAERCRVALAAREAAVGSATVGWGCQLVPVFVCVGRKPGRPDAA